MEKKLLDDIEVYRKFVFSESAICTTYETLMRFVSRLRSDLLKKPINIVSVIFLQVIWITRIFPFTIRI
ncbi:hypothetical protein ACFQOY_04225 [Enterococcus alcedinis]|uniref:hypothetical protein n=1 Tax=Enterococcus alcedinis TaxID=1274384 RepID=UPI003606DC20